MEKYVGQTDCNKKYYYEFWVGEVTMNKALVQKNKWNAYLHTEFYGNTQNNVWIMEIQMTQVFIW